MSELGLHYCMGFSLVAESWGYSLVVVCRLLIVVASIVVEHGVQARWTSVVAARRSSCCGSPGSWDQAQ